MIAQRRRRSHSIRLPVAAMSSLTRTFAPSSNTLLPTVTRVATILTPAERSRVDAAGVGLYRSIHRDTVDAVISDVREARATAVLLSVSYCERLATDNVASMLHKFPRIPTLALL